MKSQYYFIINFLSEVFQEKLFKKEAAYEKPLLIWCALLLFYSDGLFYLNSLDSLSALDIFLRELYFQNAVIVAGIDIAGLNIVYTEASGIGTVISFFPDIFILVFLIFFLFVGSRNGQEIIFQIDVNIFFLEARQFCLQQIAVTLIDDIRSECVAVLQFVISPEVSESIVKHLIE